MTRLYRGKFSRHRVLVVDDDTDLAETMASVLASELPEVEVEKAHSGEEALIALRAGPFDLVLLDVSMPSMSGPDVVKWLRVEGVVVPVLLVSGRGDEDLEMLATACGAAGWVAKPPEPARLVEAVRKLLT